MQTALRRGRRATDPEDCQGAAGPKFTKVTLARVLCHPMRCANQP